MVATRRAIARPGACVRSDAFWGLDTAVGCLSMSRARRNFGDVLTVAQIELLWLLGPRGLVRIVPDLA
jgi:hypothetical protein